jgi:hypothetical protein
LLPLAVLLAVLGGAAPSIAGAGGTPVARLASGPGTGARTASHLQVIEYQPRSTVRTSTALRQAATATTIKLFHYKQVDGGTSYAGTVVGKNPFVVQTNPSTTIKTFLVDVKVVNGSDTFDPAASDICDPASASALTRTEKSPMFKNHLYTWGGTAIFSTAIQYLDAFQRSQFWSDTNSSGINPLYHLKLGFPATLTNVLNFTATTSGWPEVSGGCGGHSLLEIDIGTWDSFVQSTLLPDLAASGVGATNFPIILVHNVVFTSGGGCCILGYHSAFGNPTQTYATANYDTTGFFAGAQDISALSHEVGEWANDPLINNPTPAWGHIGQVSGCQNNLEVGDPLSGTTLGVPLGGFTYHPQEMAFFSWFYHQSPSLGVNGWFSNQGTFGTAAAPCS